jgi:hypothetical protein
MSISPGDSREGALSGPAAANWSQGYAPKNKDSIKSLLTPNRKK